MRTTAAAGDAPDTPGSPTPRADTPDEPVPTSRVSQGRGQLGPRTLVYPDPAYRPADPGDQEWLEGESARAEAEAELCAAVCSAVAALIAAVAARAASDSASVAVGLTVFQYLRGGK